MAVVQLFQATPDRHNWSKFRTGVACFVKDNVKKTYYIRLVDIGVRERELERERGGRDKLSQRHSCESYSIVNVCITTTKVVHSL